MQKWYKTKYFAINIVVNSKHTYFPYPFIKYNSCFVITWPFIVEKNTNNHRNIRNLIQSDSAIISLLRPRLRNPQKIIRIFLESCKRISLNIIFRERAVIEIFGLKNYRKLEKLQISIPNEASLQSNEMFPKVTKST